MTSTTRMIPSLRYGVPAFSVIGNLGTDTGPAQPISLSDIAKALVATSIVASPGGTPNLTLTQPAAGMTITGSGGAYTFTFTNDLAAVEGLAGTGLAARTAADTWATRSIAQPAAGITVTNGDGVAGNPTLALANDLAAVEGLSTTGIATRTAADTWTTRTITGTANRLTVTNGDGVAGAPTLDISATYVGQTSITTLGTITTGTWDAGAVTTSGQLRSTYNGSGVYPASQTTGGYAVTTNFGGNGETDFWNLVEAATTPGFAFYEKTGASTAALIATLYGDGSFSELDLPGGGLYSETAKILFFSNASGTSAQFDVTDVLGNPILQMHGDGIIAGGATGGATGAGTVNATGYFLNGTALAAANLSNGTTGTGAVVLASAATLTNPTLSNPIVSSCKVSASVLTKTADTAFADVPGLTFALTAGKTYIIRAYLYVTNAPAAGGVKATLAGTGGLSATSMRLTGVNYNGTTTNARTTATTLGTAVAAATAVATDVEIEAYINVNAGGTISVQAAQNAASGSTVIGLGSHLECIRVN